MYVVVVMIIIFVCVIQTAFDIAARRADKRSR